MDDATLERLADLVVGYGANVHRDQIVSVSCQPGKERLTRQIAASAYRAGAKFVDVTWFDPHIKRARVEHARDDTLEYVPPWYGERMLALGEHRAARIGLSGPVEPTLFDGLDPRRLARDPLPRLPEALQVVNAMTTNWTLVPCPTPEWAALVHPELEGDEALALLWEDIARVTRLDADDPAAAWRDRADRLRAVAGRLNGAGLQALHFRGPGTDLEVGLLPGSRWMGGWMETVDGITHVPNLPTEEVFTAPDPARVSGEVRSTKPLVLAGTTVRGLRVRFA